MGGTVALRSVNIFFPESYSSAANHTHTEVSKKKGTSYYSNELWEKLPYCRMIFNEFLLTILLLPRSHFLQVAIQVGSPIR